VEEAVSLVRDDEAVEDEEAWGWLSWAFGDGEKEGGAEVVDVEARGPPKTEVHGFEEEEGSWSKELMKSGVVMLALSSGLKMESLRSLLEDPAY